MEPNPFPIDPSDRGNFGRNDYLRDLIAAGQKPMMPIEIALLKQKFGRLVSRQEELGTLLGSAMHQASETFHDNAPAEAVRDESKTLSTHAEMIIDLVHDAVEVSYPPPEYSVATLGSIITISFNDKGELERYVLAGGLPSEDFQHKTHGKLHVITLSSAAGQALLGSSIGQKISYSVANRTGSRKVNILVHEIVQLDGSEGLVIS